MCGKHYRRWKAHGDATLSERPTYGKGFITENGYVLIRMPDHPRAGQNGYVPQHVLVMEKVLGRAVRFPETIHHKNGVRNDNRPENLELWKSSHRPGQRVSDLVQYALELLNTYHGEATVFNKKSNRLLENLIVKINQPDS